MHLHPDRTALPRLLHSRAARPLAAPTSCGVHRCRDSHDYVEKGRTTMMSMLPKSSLFALLLTPTVTAAFCPAASCPPVHGGRAGRRCAADHVWWPSWAPPSWCPALCTLHWVAVSHSPGRRGCAGDSCCAVVCRAKAPSAAPLWAVWEQRQPPTDANGSVEWASRRSELYRWPSRMCPHRRIRCVAAKSCAPAEVKREEEGKERERELESSTWRSRLGLPPARFPCTFSWRH